MRIYWTIPRIVPKFSIKFQQKRSFIDEIDYFFALETYIVTECRHIIDHFEHRKKKKRNQLERTHRWARMMSITNGAFKNCLKSVWDKNIPKLLKLHQMSPKWTPLDNPNPWYKKPHELKTPQLRITSSQIEYQSPRPTIPIQNLFCSFIWKWIFLAEKFHNIRWTLY